MLLRKQQWFIHHQWLSYELAKIIFLLFVNLWTKMNRVHVVSCPSYLLEKVWRVTKVEDPDTEEDKN